MRAPTTPVELGIVKHLFGGADWDDPRTALKGVQVFEDADDTVIGLRFSGAKAFSGGQVDQLPCAFAGFCREKMGGVSPVYDAKTVYRGFLGNSGAKPTGKKGKREEEGF